MDINSSTPLSDLSETTQANNKYKKALKQINRLISINNSTKKDLTVAQEQCDVLRRKYSQLEEKYIALEEEMRSETVNRTFLHVPKVTNSCEYSMTISNHNIEDAKLGLPVYENKEKNSSPLSARAKQLENTGTLSEYMDTKHKLEKVEQKLQTKDKQIQAIVLQLQLKTKQNAELSEKYLQASNHLKKLRNEVELKKSDDLSLKIEELQNEISKYKQINSKITKENEGLKRNQKTEGIEKKSSNTKGFSAFSIGDSSPVFTSMKGRPPAVPFHQCFYTSAQQSLRNTEQIEGDHFPSYYLKKVRDLEQEISKLKKQHLEKRSGYKNQISSLKETVQKKDEHIKQISSFMIKQQAFIESLYEKSQYEQKAIKQPPKMVSSLLEYTDSYPNLGIGTLSSKNSLSKKALLANSQEHQGMRQRELEYFKN